MDFIEHFLEATTVVVMMIAILIMIAIDPIILGATIIGVVITIEIKKGESRRAFKRTCFLAPFQKIKISKPRCDRIASVNERGSYQC